MPRRGNDDPKRPDVRTEIRDFAGYIPSEDPHDIPPGAGVVQVNATSSRPGELRVRLGAQVLKFDG